MSQRNVQVQPGVFYGTREDQSLSFDVFRPHAANGAAVLFVNSGGFESGKLVQYAAAHSGSYRALSANELTVEGVGEPIPALAQFSFQRLLEAGFTVFDVRHANAPATFDLMLDDIRTAISYIHEHAGEFEIDTQRIGIFGASSGGFLAIASGLTAEDCERRLIGAIATYYPAGYDFPADADAFPQVIESIPALAVDRSVMEAYSLKNLYQAGGPPTLIIYGDQDFPFILNPCNSILAEFPKAGIETKGVVIEGAAHEFMREDGYRAEDGDRAQAQMLDWFTLHLLG